LVRDVSQSLGVKKETKGGLKKSDKKPGNFREKTPCIETPEVMKNNEKTEPRPKRESNVLGPSGIFSKKEVRQGVKRKPSSEGTSENKNKGCQGEASRGRTPLQQRI